MISVKDMCLKMEQSLQSESAPKVAFCVFA